MRAPAPSPSATLAVPQVLATTSRQGRHVHRAFPLRVLCSDEGVPTLGPGAWSEAAAPGPDYSWAAIVTLFAGLQPGIRVARA